MKLTNMNPPPVLTTTTPRSGAQLSQASAWFRRGRLAWAVGLLSAGALSASADVITQVTSQGARNATGWVAAIWGPTTNVPTSGTTYVIPSGFTLRTPNNSASVAFPGDWLVNTDGSTKRRA
jgi:hypothetical protein